MDKLAYLSEIDLLSGLSRRELKAIDRIAPMQSLPKGTLISDPVRPERVLYLLKRGYVRLYRIGPEGRQLTVGLLRAGNIFGEIEALSTGTRNTYAEALSDVLLCGLREPDLERLLRSNPEVAMRMVRLLSERLRETEELLERLALGDVKTRLLYLATRLAENFGARAGRLVRVDLELSQEDLAHMIGSTRETVSLTLGELARAGAVRTARRRLWVDLRRARALLDEG